MALTTLNSFDDIFDRNTGRLFERLFANRYPVSSPNTLSLDMKDTENGYEVKVDLPGVDRQNISVTAENGVLTISAVRSSTKESGDNDRYYFSERGYGSVSRSVRLPKNASDEDITAKYEDGVLTVCLIKSENNGRKSITIN